MKAPFVALLLSLASLGLHAQSAPVFTSTCQENYGSGNQKSYCETRDLTMSVAKGGRLTVDGQHNGGITVKGYAGSEIRVRALVKAWAGSEADAKAHVAAISISTADNTLQATGSTDAKTYAVSYEIFVPEEQALALRAHNGGIHLENLRGPVSFETQNGGVSITGSGGDVKGHTQNGGLSITLTGSKWTGAGLDVATTNGGISWHMPAEYAAALSTSTQHGRVRSDFPSNVKGSIRSTSLDVVLGQGGAPVKAVTVNGGISVAVDGKQR